MPSIFPDSEVEQDYAEALKRLFSAAHELNEPAGKREIIKQVDEARQALFIISAVAPLVAT